MVVQQRSGADVVAPIRLPVLLRAAGAAGAAALLALTACSSASPSTGAGVEAAGVERATEPGLATAAVSSADSADVPATTAAPTTAPPTTAAPTTTAPPTTAAPPPATVPPPLPITPLPAPIVETIEPLAVPLSAVGSRSGGETARAQQRLLDLGFWLEAADGQYGLTTRQAVMAFQKYMGFEASGSLDELTAAYLSNLPEQARARADAGTLVEVDKGRQLIFMVVDGRTQWVFNTSTGSEQPYTEVNQKDPAIVETGDSVTPAGLHQVNRERPTGWWEGDLGRIYRPKYFVGGVAVHGSSSVPNYPASHGCVRVTVEAMDFIWNSGLMPMNIPVWVHV